MVLYLSCDIYNVRHADFTLQACISNAYLTCRAATIYGNTAVEVCILNAYIYNVYPITY